MTRGEGDEVYGTLRDWVQIGPHRIEFVREHPTDSWQESARSTLGRGARGGADADRGPAAASIMGAQPRSWLKP
jgi:hypothetical protein